MWYGMRPSVSTHSTDKVVLTLVRKVRKAGREVVTGRLVGQWRIVGETVVGRMRWR
jgi:hypothetical protein